MKTCGGECKESKPLSDFHKDPSRKGGLAPWCKACKNKHRKRLRKKRRDELQQDPYIVWREQIFAPDLIKWKEKHMKTKRDACYDCNIFHISCLGEKFEKPKGHSSKGCINQERSPDNTKSKIQVVAFDSLYKARIDRGMNKLVAFAGSIADTSDDAWAKAQRDRPHMIERRENK